LRYPTVEVDGLYRRLIPSKYPTIDLYERFGSAQMQALAADLEKLTNPRLQARTRIASGEMPADTGSPMLQNWNHAPFAYPLPEGSQFLPPPYPVMELAETEIGALARAVLRREEFLSRTDEPLCGVDMRVIANRIKGKFIDLRALPADMAPQAKWLIGQELYAEEISGIVFKMNDVAKCDFIGILRLDVLQDKGVQGAHYRFRWDGTRISRIFDFAANADIDRSAILSAQRVAA
jgi:hypothetical protein